ncbi:hypothetical protein N8776_01425 [bacterium]|nr:hypothetical protein [bacterium]
MNDKKFFILSVIFLVTIVVTAFADLDYISMGLSFVAMAFCFWYIKSRSPQK